MSSTAVLGCIFGDEAKAKIVDVLAADADIIVRFQGGSNAGHTIQFENKKFVMHLIPSGIFHEHKVCILGSGVVLDPEQLEKEMEALQANGVSFENRFFIDERTSLVLPIHKEIDAWMEELKEDDNIGTTKRGIGPCYSDSISRIGLRMCDLDNKEYIVKKLNYLYKYHKISESQENLKALSERYFQFGNRMKKYMMNIPYYLDKAYRENKEILFEGAQGTLLDIYFGTYPFVTSSHTVSGGISVASGYAPNRIDLLVGVYKSYFTRVGSGPFPTEQINSVGDQIRKQGNEFGSTTGRPRRCGWFDAVAAKFSAMINGIDSIALTLLDVLSGVNELYICDHYEINGKAIYEFPADQRLLAQAKPVYIKLEGWTEDISDCKSWDELPERAKDYVRKIEVIMDIPINILSVGPNRDQTIFLIQEDE